MNIAVVGLGKLGLPMAALFASKGHKVTGIDLETSVVRAVNDRTDPYDETGLDELLKNLSLPSLQATSDFAPAGEADVIFIVVPTPSDANGRFRNDYVLDAINRMGPYLIHTWQTVVVSSTVMPGSMDNFIMPALEAATLKKVGQGVGLAYNPQFIALGSVLANMANPDFVLIGARESRSAGDVADALEPVVGGNTGGHATTFINAELAKLALNAYVTMKISFANTLAQICESVPGADAVAVTDIIGTDSRIGNKYLMPGGPASGPCFPRDCLAFSTLDEDIPSSLALATQEVNDSQVWRIQALFSGYGSVAILGVAYKPGTPVIEWSLGHAVGEALAASGVDVSWHDPMARVARFGKNRPAQEAVARSEAVLLALPDPSYPLLDYGDRFVVDVWRQLPLDRPNTFTVGLGAR